VLQIVRRDDVNFNVS